MLKKEVKLLDGPLSCLSENVAFTQLAVGGRNIFKIFDCQKQSFEEVANLRNGIAPQLHLSINDVNWCKADEKTLVSASIQGAVVIWDMSASGQAKQVFVISEHQRSVNCLEFLPHSSNLLMTASQDGSCRVIDLRQQENASTFGPSVESPAREVKFNPRNHQHFSAAFENGLCQIWDMRHTGGYIRHWLAHSGPCVCMDWHHSENWLITGGRDKTAAVWDFSDCSRKTTSKYSAETVASIGKVKWRPNYKYQVLITPMLTESHASVWDVRRPYLADVFFVEHKDSIGDVLWKTDEMFYTCGRDSKLCRFTYNDRKDLRESFHPVCLSVNIYGSVVHCTHEKELYYPSKKAHDGLTDAGETDSVLTQNSITTEHAVKCLSMDAFLEMAKAYRLNNDSFSNLCNHNAQVAARAGMHQIATTWSMLVLMLDEEVVKETKKKQENKALAFPDVVFSKMDDKAAIKRAPSVGGSSSKDTDHHHHLLHSSSSSHHPFSNHFTFLDQPDIFANDVIESLKPPQEDSQHVCSMEQDLIFPSEVDWQSRLSDLANSGPFNEDSESPTTDYSSFTPSHSRRIEVQEVVKREILTVAPFTEGIEKFNYCPLILQMLHQFANQNDVQSAVSMALVLGERIRPHIDQKVFDFWATSYIDKLNDFKLFIASTDVQNCYQPNEPQASTSIRLSCSYCCRIMKQGWLCKRCPDKNRLNFIHTCALCHLPVKGHYLWCQGCCHGGHYSHIVLWFQRHKQCPTGCGHLCEYN